MKSSYLSLPTLHDLHTSSWRWKKVSGALGRREEYQPDCPILCVSGMGFTFALPQKPKANMSSCRPVSSRKASSHIGMQIAAACERDLCWTLLQISKVFPKDFSFQKALPSQLACCFQRS